LTSGGSGGAGGAGVSSASTGFGSSLAGVASISALFSIGTGRTEKVCGKYPSSLYVTVNGSMTGTDNSHGVWQMPPFEVLTDAPRGLESIVKVASVDGASQSKRGVFEDTDEQLASAKPNTTATNPAVLITSVLFPTTNSIHGPRLRGAGSSMAGGSSLCSMRASPQSDSSRRMDGSPRSPSRHTL
jgi:hypothetical protein